jgi:hypothetical protein
VLMVGMTRFERATPWSQTRCAAKLRHIPLARMEGFEPPTLAALETTALPVELHPYELRPAAGTVSGRRELNPRDRLCRPVPILSVTTAVEPVTSLELAPSVWRTDVQPVTPHRLRA